MDQTTVEQASQHLFEYGILGILVLLLGWIMWNSYKRILEKNDELEKKVDTLQQEMISLVSDERDRMANLVQKNTEAINELSKIILQYMVEHK